MFSHTCVKNTMRKTLRKALSKGVSLRSSDLSNTDLRKIILWDGNSDFSDSDLRGCNMSENDLSGINLSGLDLSGCNFTGAYLANCTMNGTDLSGANLSNSDMSDCDITGCNMLGSNLTNVELTDCYLTPIRDDIWAILSSVPNEVSSLISAIKEGRIDGSVYTGDCACLIGTIANIRHVNNHSIDGVTPNYARPAEQFFLGIMAGDTPETSQFSALALQWCEEWLNRMQAAFGKTK